MACEHRKVFSGERLLTGIPQYAWICESCGDQGTDQLAEPPPADRKAFAAALLAFHGQDADNARWARTLDPTLSPAGPSKPA
jgi:hypothetical protein